MLEQNKFYEILKRPVVTEKCTAMREKQNKVLVEVAGWASKNQIVQAVKMLFNVDVLAVNTLNYRGKIKRVRKYIGKRQNFKRAYLTLKNGADVDLFGTVGHEVPQAEGNK